MPDRDKIINGTPTATVILIGGTVADQVNNVLNSLVKWESTKNIQLIIVSREGCLYPKNLENEFHEVQHVFFADEKLLQSAFVDAVEKSRSENLFFFEDHVEIIEPVISEIVELFQVTKSACIGWTLKPYKKTFAVWTGFLIEKSGAGPGVKEGFVRSPVPSNTIAFRKSVLTGQHENLQDLLKEPYLLQTLLLNKGYKIYFTDKISILHSHFLKFRQLAAGQFWNGWHFAGSRQKLFKWNYFKRIAAALLMPLKPLIRWKVILRTPMDRDFYPKFLLIKQFLPVMVVLYISTMGEILGHLFGECNSTSKLNYFELDINRDQFNKSAGTGTNEHA